MKRINEHMRKVAKVVREALDHNICYWNMKENDHIYFKLFQWLRTWLRYKETGKLWASKLWFLSVFRTLNEVSRYLWFLKISNREFIRMIEFLNCSLIFKQHIYTAIESSGIRALKKSLQVVRGYCKLFWLATKLPHIWNSCLSFLFANTSIYNSYNISPKEVSGLPTLGPYSHYTCDFIAKNVHVCPIANGTNMLYIVYGKISLDQ